MSRPSMRTCPRRGFTRPLIVRSSVVLPAPFAPSTAVIVAVSASTLTPSSAVTPPYPATRPSTASALLMGDSQVGRGHRGIGLNLGRRSGRDDLAEVEDGDRVADRHPQVHVMLHHDHRAVRSELADQLP